ncbi:maturase, partial [Halobacillus trueperi]
MNYYSLIDTLSVLKELESWLHRRLR